MMIAGWKDEIAHAESPSALVEIVKRFVNGIDASELRQLPEECRPVRIGRPADIAYWAFTLTTATLLPESPPLLHQLSLIFADASTRLAAIAHVEDHRARLRSAVIDRD
jgi:hypothetical protein